MKKGLKVFFKYLFLFLIGGAIYVIIELVCRGRSHRTRAVVGGICFVLCGLHMEIYDMVSNVDLQPDYYGSRICKRSDFEYPLWTCNLGLQ